MTVTRLSRHNACSRILHAKKKRGQKEKRGQDLNTEYGHRGFRAHGPGDFPVEWLASWPVSQESLLRKRADSSGTLSSSAFQESQPSRCCKIRSGEAAPAIAGFTASSTCYSSPSAAIAVADQIGPGVSASR
jgi:hypothetical protein